MHRAKAKPKREKAESEKVKFCGVARAFGWKLIKRGLSEG
jgi:hypothetical protein